MAMSKKIITFEQLNNAFDDAMRIATKCRTEKQRKTLRINFAQELRKALDAMDKEEFKRTGTCWNCKHYDREEEECLIIKRWFGEDILGGHEMAVKEMAGIASLLTFCGECVCFNRITDTLGTCERGAEGTKTEDDFCYNGDAGEEEE